jgi:hypothetical protein
MSKSADKVELLLKELSALNLAPRHIELTKVGTGFFATVFNNADRASPITESVAVGFSNNSGLAILKGLTEWLERLALFEGAKNGEECCRTERSDGMAAYPVILSDFSFAKENARKNAFNEALERYTWSTWWDNPRIAHKKFNIKDKSSIQSSAFSGLISACEELIEIERIDAIIPKSPQSESRAHLVILFCYLKSGGVLTGGAAGNLVNTETWVRAASELFRHCLAFTRILALKSHPTTFYQRRIAHFGYGNASDFVAKRLSQSGNEQVILPSLKFDQEVKYSCSHIVYAHRCLFENQPQFMGGNLERLCF